MAKIVKESINFERHKDPHRALGVGKEIRLIKQVLNININGEKYILKDVYVRKILKEWENNNKENITSDLEFVDEEDYGWFYFSLYNKIIDYKGRKYLIPNE